MRFYYALIFIFLILISPLFFFKLGQTSLVSWDEAWYAEIARNIVKTSNPINLSWNGEPYFDHPPAGFWIMSLTYKFFGVNEFWTRFPSAVSGLISIFLLYLVGRKLFNPLVGFSSAIALSSAIWFIYRSRSGNLDIILTFFFIFTLYLALKATENKKLLWPFMISLSMLFLIKTMVPFVIIPSLILIFWKNKLYKLSDLTLPSLLFLTIIGSWFASQLNQHPSFLQTYFGVGLRGASLQTSYFENLNLLKQYLHSGLGKWFWPTLIAAILSIFLMQKRFFILLVFVITFSIPITFSPKIQIWHLIPLFPIFILIYFGFIYAFLEKFFYKWKYQIFTIFLAFNTFIYFNQLKMIWYQFIDIPAFVSDEKILSEEASKYPQKYFVDGEYRPAALFYSKKERINQAPRNDQDFIDFFNSRESFLMITHKWRLEKLNIPSQDYQILKEDRDKVLILHTN